MNLESRHYGQTEENGAHGDLEADVPKSGRATVTAASTEGGEKQPAPKAASIPAAPLQCTWVCSHGHSLPSLCRETHCNQMSQTRVVPRQNVLQIREKFWHGYLIQVSNTANKMYGFEHYFSQCIKSILKN